MLVETINSLDEAALRDRLTTCLGVPRWVDELLAGRPYVSDDAVLSTARASAASLSAAELELALAGHPRIGERATSPAHSAEHSSREQAGVDHSDDSVTSALAAGNAAYEERFDRVFLIRAAGRDAAEILAELQRRLTNDDDTERAETVTQLGEIALLRLEQLG